MPTKTFTLLPTRGGLAMLSNATGLRSQRLQLLCVFILAALAYGGSLHCRRYAKAQPGIRAWTREQWAVLDLQHRRERNRQERNHAMQGLYDRILLRPWPSWN